MLDVTAASLQLIGVAAASQLQMDAPVGLNAQLVITMLHRHSHIEG